MKIETSVIVKKKTNECPLLNNCKERPVVYKATIQAGGEEYLYIGFTQDFKQRYSNQKAYFRNKELKNATFLSKFSWDNNIGPDPNIKFEIISKGQIYQNVFGLKEYMSKIQI